MLLPRANLMPSRRERRWFTSERSTSRAGQRTSERSTSQGWSPCGVPPASESSEYSSSDSESPFASARDRPQSRPSSRVLPWKGRKCHGQQSRSCGVHQRVCSAAGCDEFGRHPVGTRPLEWSRPDGLEVHWQFAGLVKKTCAQNAWCSYCTRHHSHTSRSIRVN